MAYMSDSNLMDKEGDACAFSPPAYEMPQPDVQVMQQKTLQKPKKTKKGGTKDINALVEERALESDWLTSVPLVSKGM